MKDFTRFRAEGISRKPTRILPGPPVWEQRARMVEAHVNEPDMNVRHDDLEDIVANGPCRACALPADYFVVEA